MSHCFYALLFSFATEPDCFLQEATERSANMTDYDVLPSATLHGWFELIFVALPQEILDDPSRIR